jgi:hypothetical protein
VNDSGSRFNGLFGVPGLMLPRSFSGFRWEFRGTDANGAARSLFSRLDEVFDLLQVPGFSFLSTIELRSRAFAGARRFVSGVFRFR